MALLAMLIGCSVPDAAAVPGEPDAAAAPGEPDAGSPLPPLARSSVPGDVNWPQFGYGSSGAFSSTARLPVSPQLRWQVNLLDDYYGGYADPFLEHGRLFVPVYGDGLYALNSATGEVLWHSAFWGPKYGVGVVAGDTVITGPSTWYEPVIFALRVNTGEEVWRVPLHVLGPLKLGHNTIFATDVNDLRLHAIDALTGSTSWVSAAECVSTPAVSDGRAYCLSSEALVCIDASSGATVFTVPAEPGLGGTTAAPTIADGRVFYAGTQLHAHDALDGAALWTASFGPGYTGNLLATTPAAAYGRVFVAGEGETIAFRADTGEELWRTPGAGAGTTLIVADGLVVDNRPGILDAATGAELWAQGPYPSGETRLVVTDGRMFAVTDTQVTAWYGDVPGPPPEDY